MARSKTNRHREEFEVFERYLAENRLKRSRQREVILERFLGTEGHLSVDDLYSVIQRKDPDIGRTTIYRTLKLLCDAGLAKTIELQDGLTRFEHVYRQGQHDHLICTSCGAIVEFRSDEIENLQRQIAESHGYTVDSHRHQLFGACSKCRRKRPISGKGLAVSRNRVKGASALNETHSIA